MRAICFLLLLLVGVGGVAAQSRPATRAAEDLIEQLGDSRAAVRDQAAAALTAMGQAARPALAAAIKHDDPEIALRAQALLRHLPWHVADDPKPVRDLLQRHANLPAEQRSAVVQQLLSLPRNQGAPALMRLLQFDTDPALRWSIVTALRQQLQRPRADAPAPAPDELEIDIPLPRLARALLNPDLHKYVRQLDPASTDPAVLCALAASYRTDDEPRAVQLYRRATESIDLKSLDGRSEIEYAFDNVFAADYAAERWDDLARLLRRKAGWSGAEQAGGIPEAVAELFLLHARVPGLAGERTDRLAFVRYQMHPLVVYAHADAVRRAGFVRTGRAIDRIALLVGSTDPAPRLETGELLMRHTLARPASREYLAGVNLIKGEEMADMRRRLDARLPLSQQLYGSGEFAQAGRQIQILLEEFQQVNEQGAGLTLLINRRGRQLQGDEAHSEFVADMHGYFLLDALLRNDELEITRRLDALRETPSGNSEIVQEQVAWYDRQNNRQAADKLFGPIEQQLRDQLKADPSPHHKNSLAWFYARCGRKLDEALKLANEAVAAAPSTAAFIDTLAEVHFAKGDVEQAITLEKQAWKVDPGRPELELQMKRFLKGRKR